MSDQLKPCPFCGSSMCQTYLSGEAESVDAAIKAWNRRALEAQA